MWTHMANFGQSSGSSGFNSAAMGHGMGYYNVQGAGMMNLSNGQAMGYMGMPGSGFDIFQGGILTTLITVLFWALILAGAVFLARRIWDALSARKQGGVATAAPGQAFEILKERLAKGEISRPEFEELKQILA